MPGNRAASAKARVTAPATASPAVLRERACKEGRDTRHQYRGELGDQRRPVTSGDLVLLGGELGANFQFRKSLNRVDGFEIERIGHG